MARFLMWMATFFTMATFWKFMGSVWSLWKDKDFLQVQRGHCKRLSNDISSLENYLKAMEASPKSKVLNQNQCVHLFGKLVGTMKGINKMLSSATKDLQFQSIFEELCYLQKKVEILGKQCMEQERWCHSAIFQLRNRETFRELLLDLKCCYNTSSELFLFLHPNQSNHILPVEFDAATYEQILEDGQVLKTKLDHVSQEEVSRDYEIAQHLLWRLKTLDRVDGGDLDALEVPHGFQTPKFIKKIGNGGDVYQTNWLGLACATKVLEGDLGGLMNSQNEVGILAGLSHPNLVQFFGCGIIKNTDKRPEEEGIGEMQLMMRLKKSSLFQMLKNLIQYFRVNRKNDEDPQEDETSQLHLVMELMETSLSTILKKAKRPLSYLVAIDIMHQIAKGVHYLHDMQVAHLDLKPDNILSSSIPTEGLDPCRTFKVMDYGTSQLEVCSTPKPPMGSEPLQCPIGTLGYMSPEVIRGSNSLYRFQADAWSFAMICSEILSGKVPYSDLGPTAFYDQIKGTTGCNFRPDLPKDCEGLTNLIRECWSQDPLQRPTFSSICERLTNLKKFFLKEGSCVLRDSKSIGIHVSRVVEHMAISKDVPVDLDLQLSKAKGLLELNYIGIVGMGGIGKTTLAKARFDDKTVNSSYYASCFVAECKNYQSSYGILCKILPKLGIDEKTENFEGAQEMMKEVLVEKKVLLILDDVKDETQVHDIVPLDFVQVSKGSSIILTTRRWSTIKSFVDVEGRLDVELLDEEAATTLFTTHLSWSEVPLSSNFVALRKHVVQACNGLPLSLKVLGSFLHNRTRLRSWERALQRLARGRNLDGDEGIWNSLQTSYDGLSNDVEKGMFLDVACFFCRDIYPRGISRETMLSMWSRDGILPIGELERLIDMSLLKVNEGGGILEMHDQLRDMGRMIAKSTRIWNTSMIPNNEFSSEDAKVLEGISWQGTLVKSAQSLDFEKLHVLIIVTTLNNLEARCENLDLFLQLASQCSNLEAIFLQFSEDWYGLQHTFLTGDLPLRRRILDLCGACASLKILHLVGFGFFDHFLDKFASSHTLLGLDLSSSSHFSALPKEVGNWSSLTTLVLEHCSDLEALRKEVGNLSSLTTLNLAWCTKLDTLPKEVGNLSSLTTLNLTWCTKLDTLPKEVGNLSSLTTLNLKGCSKLEALPKEVGTCLI